MVKGLEELARLYGVLTEYVDSWKNIHRVEEDVILGVLRAFGAAVDGPDSVAGAIRVRREELAARWLEPVAVAWDGAKGVVPVHLSESEGASRLECSLVREDGEELTWTAEIGELERLGDAEAGGITLGLALPMPLPIGYHRLRVSKGGESRECLVIAAPTKIEGETRGRAWGLFCPLYALHSRKSWGAGDFGDLAALMDWTAERGGGLVATLPMLASAFDDRPSISPYSPVSRLFWNEFYLDLGAIPELARSAEARALIESPGFRREVEALRSDRLVDYGRQMKLKRRVLELLAEAAAEGEFERSPDFLRFLEDYPDARTYADFMSRVDRHGPRWQTWTPGSGDERAIRYHLYVQWQADVQLRALSERAEAQGLTWYVDFTVGVDPHSYDVWAHPDVFARGASVGCPPDEGFTSGQNWGFPPPHPDRQRESGYAYLIAALRNHLRYARALRVDHVMGLHRLYCIPEGRPTGGAYVAYPVDEHYAILAVEAHRRGAWVVGENLGTVPPEVPVAMQRHGLRGLYVLQHELSTGDREFDEVPADVVASINTHDMPTFDSFWAGRDIGQRIALGLLRGPVSEHEVADRPEERAALLAHLRRKGLLDPEADPDVGTVYRACCEFLAGSPAPMTIFNLEDFWLEPAPQNTPGTVDNPPNWRRKLRYTFEEFANRPEVVGELRRIDERRGAGPSDGTHFA